MRINRKRGGVPAYSPPKKAKISKKWSKNAKIIMNNSTNEEIHTRRG
jgi:hypothetical protein